MIKKKTRNSKTEALLQILILVIGIIAISYAVGSSVEVVSAASEDLPACKADSCDDDGDCRNCCDGLRYAGSTGTCDIPEGNAFGHCNYFPQLVDGRCRYTKPPEETDSKAGLVDKGIEEAKNLAINIDLSSSSS